MAVRLLAIQILGTFPLSGLAALGNSYLPNIINIVDIRSVLLRFSLVFSAIFVLFDNFSSY